MRYGWLSLSITGHRYPSFAGRRLALLRTQHGLTVARVAKAVDLTIEMLFEIESGVRSLSNTDAARVADVINALAEGRCFVCHREIQPDGTRINSTGAHPRCWAARATTPDTRAAIRESAARRRRA